VLEAPPAVDLRLGIQFATGVFKPLHLLTITKDGAPFGKLALNVKLASVTSQPDVQRAEHSSQLLILLLL